MVASVTHAKVSGKADGADATEVLASDWNAGHTISITAADISAAPNTGVDYLVGTATGSLTGEIVAGTAPGGELGGTWASPTVDATHSGSAHVALTANTPQAVGTAAVGNGTASARDNHIHATGAGTPSTQAFSDAAATGTGPAASMTDHKHAMPADPFLAGRKLFATFSKQGAVAVTTEGDSPPPMRVYNDSGRTLTFHTIRATATTAPVGATMVIDVNVGGTTIMTGTKVVIADGGNTVTQTTFSTTTIADGGYVSMNVDSVGSGTAGSNLTVSVWVTG